MWFQQFSVKGDADRTLLYLTLYVHHLICAMKDQTKEGYKKKLLELRNKQFSAPGDGGFPLAGFLNNPKNSGESDNWKAYMKQCREEINVRFIDILFLHPTAEGLPDKWWTMFAKRKFLGKSL